MPLLSRPPTIDGLAASTLQLPAGPWTTVLEALADHFPAISRDAWLDRMSRGRVLDGQGNPLTANSLYSRGSCVYYYREVPAEIAVPFTESILYADAHLVVADKPHFLPVTPVGTYVQETLLTRLVRTLGNPDLVPLHRIDRGTAGLVLFSPNPQTRALYQALFRDRKIDKHYLAIAPALPSLEFPLTRTSRIVRGEPFHLSRETVGTPNAETRIEVEYRGGKFWRYSLSPLTGKKHQLRVHLNALGAPILGDDLYPEIHQRSNDDFSRPLQLLARSLKFTDPLSGAPRQFTSRFELKGDDESRQKQGIRRTPDGKS